MNHRSMWCRTPVLPPFTSYRLASSWLPHPPPAARPPEFKVQLPVLWGTPEAINDAHDTAAQLRSAVPVGTRVVIVVRDQGPSMVAMEASTGELVGFHVSLDPALAGLNVDGLARQLSAAIGASGQRIRASSRRYIRHYRRCASALQSGQSVRVRTSETAFARRSLPPQRPSLRRSA